MRATIQSRARPPVYPDFAGSKQSRRAAKPSWPRAREALQGTDQAYRTCAVCWSTVFIAHSFVQVSLNMTMPLWLLSLVKQPGAKDDTFFSTWVELIAHSFVQMSRNFTVPVSRYSLVRQVVVPAVAGVDAAVLARLTGLTGAGSLAGLTGAATVAALTGVAALAGLGALATTAAGLTGFAAARYFSC